MKMKNGWIVFAMAAALFLGGCSFDQIVQDQWGLLAIKNASRALGYAVANSKSTIDDAAVVEAYSLFKTGQVDPAKMNEILGRFSKDPANKLLILAALDLLQAMGATISGGTIVDLTKIPPELWSIVEVSYQQGYELGKLDRRAGITRAIP